MAIFPTLRASRNRRRRGRLLSRATDVFAIVALLLGTTGCDRTADPLPGPPGTTVVGEVMSVGGPEGYITSTACRECHAKEFQTWHASFHRTMTQAADRESVVADFGGIALEAGGERFTLSRTGGEHWVAIEDLDEIASTPPGASPPPPVRVRLSLVTGSHHMQVFWLPTGHSNAQMGFPFTWLIADGRWAPRHEVFIRDPRTPPPVETWNMSCIRCHATAGQPRPRPDQEVFATRVGELGIACEACHGPGKTHVDAMRRQADSRSIHRAAGDPANAVQPGQPAEVAIIHPGHLDHVRSSQVCGQCHALKWFDRSEGWEETGFRYRPGDDLEATTPIIRPSRLADQPWIQGVIQKHPGLLEQFFWSDGMIRVAGREFNGLLESACYQRGQMSCLSCHDMHRYEAPDDQLTPVGAGDAACLQCHEASRFQAQSHTHHLAGSVGSQCYNCHMPHTTYALLKGVRQHQIDRPNLASTLRTGRPNACNLCHLDRTLAWTAAHLREWYGQAPPELSPRDHETAASVHWLLAGDAGQRALVAWHYGWAPAHQAAGSDWEAPLLARLLADPYSAVRYIAHRSLRVLPGYADFAFDFVSDSASLTNAVTAALGRWRTAAIGQPARRAALLIAEDGRSDPDRVGQLQAQRDDRPVHLRE